MLKPEFTGQFKKDYKLAVKRGCDPQKLSAVVELLCEEKTLLFSYTLPCRLGVFGTFTR